MLVPKTLLFMSCLSRSHKYDLCYHKLVDQKFLNLHEWKFDTSVIFVQVIHCQIVLLKLLENIFNDSNAVPNIICHKRRKCYRWTNISNELFDKFVFNNSNDFKSFPTRFLWICSNRIFLFVYRLTQSFSLI